MDFGPEEFSSSSEDEKQQSDHHHDNTVRNLNSANNKENVLISDEDAEEPKVNLAPNVILKENVPVFISNELTPEVKGSEDLIPKIKAEEVITDIEPVLIPKVRETTATDLTPKTRSKVVPDLQQDLDPKVTPYLTPKVTPNVIQNSGPIVTANVSIPDLTQKVRSQAIPDEEQDSVLKVTPDLTPKVTTPNVIQNSAPKVTANIPDLNRILDSKEIEIIERVTSVDESVTPLLDEPTDWSMRTIPDPPSGFKDSIVIPDQYQNPTMIPESPEIRMPNGLPTIVGPMKFSIDSYNDRTVKEEPYVVKLSRTESMRDEAPVFAKEKAAPTISKAESFSLARFNGESTISGMLIKDLPIMYFHPKSLIMYLVKMLICIFFCQQLCD